MTSTSDFSKKQLAAILSALDDAPRNPANKGEALRAIGRSAKRFGLTTDDVLAAAPGLLEGRLSPADFRVELHELAGPDQTANGGQQGPTAAPGSDDAGDSRPAPTEPPQAAQEPATPEPAAEPAAQSQAAAPATRKVKVKRAKPSRAAPVEKPTPRAGTKQAQMIEMLKRLPRSSRSPRPPAGSITPSAARSAAHSRRSWASRSRRRAPARLAPTRPAPRAARPPTGSWRSPTDNLPTPSPPRPRARRRSLRNSD